MHPLDLLLIRTVRHPPPSLQFPSGLPPAYDEWQAVNNPRHMATPSGTLSRRNKPTALTWPSASGEHSAGPCTGGGPGWGRTWGTPSYFGAPPTAGRRTCAKRVRPVGVEQNIKVIWTCEAFGQTKLRGRFSLTIHWGARQPFPASGDF